MQDREKEKGAEQAPVIPPKRKTEEKTVGEQRFSKGQLLASERFSGKRDILAALLSEKRRYSLFEAENIIEKFMKGQVK